MADQSSFLVPTLQEMVYGIDAWKKPAKVVATSNITLTGLQTVDGVALAAGDEVLVVGQSTGAQNGIWTASAGAWARRSDATTSERLFAGVRVPVTHGTHAGEVYRLTTTGKINVGTTAQVWQLDSQGGGSTEDVDPTPDTLTLRGPDGEVEAEWIQTTTWRTTSGGDAVFSEGSTTFARLRSTNAPAQIGDMRLDPTTGQPCVYIDGPGVVPLLREKVRWPKLSPDSLDSDIINAFPIFDAPGYPWTITRVRFIPRAGLSANASNYAQLQIHIRDGDGVQVGSAAIGNTTPSGTDFTGSWTAFIPVALTLQTSLLAFPIDGGHSATFSIGKQGSGVIVPAGTLEMWVAPWQDA